MSNLILLACINVHVTHCW